MFKWNNLEKTANQMPAANLICVWTLAFWVTYNVIFGNIEHPHNNTNDMNNYSSFVLVI